MNTIRLANGSTIALGPGDITTSPADAVVNAANAYLAVGGGVSGAIHAAAGPELKAECDRIALEHGPLQPGEAIATLGYRLRARHVIHVLGPVWYGGGSDEAATLETAYRNALRTANDLGLHSIALPSISTGIFGYPASEAAPVALHAIADTLSAGGSVHDVSFVLFDQDTLAAFTSAAETF